MGTFAEPPPVPKEPPRLLTPQEIYANNLSMVEFGKMVFSMSRWIPIFRKDLEEMNRGKVGRPYDFSDSLIYWILQVMALTGLSFRLAVGLLPRVTPILFCVASTLLMCSLVSDVVFRNSIAQSLMLYSPYSSFSISLRITFLDVDLVDFGDVRHLDNLRICRSFHDVRPYPGVIGHREGLILPRFFQSGNDSDLVMREFGFPLVPYQITTSQFAVLYTLGERVLPRPPPRSLDLWFCIGILLRPAPFLGFGFGRRAA